MLLSSQLRYTLYGTVLSVSLISLSVSAGTADGVFGEYFSNMINNPTIGPCSIGYNIVVGFNTSSTTSYGTRQCKSIAEILGATTGNVGIGTLSPVAKLDVTGNVFVNGKGGMSYYNQAGYNQIEFGTPTGSSVDVSFHTSGVSKMWIKPSGNVGIGTATPAAKLEVASATDSIVRLNKTTGSSWNYIEWLIAGTRKYWTGIDAAGVFNIQGDSSAAVAINAYGGNVGIGTTTPNAKLDVQGGDITIGKLGDTRKICLNGVCTDKIPDAQKGDILYAVRSDITSNQISSSYGATANDRVNNLYVAAWKRGVQDVGAQLGWSPSQIANTQSAYTDIDQMRASIKTGGSEWGTTLITSYLVPGLKNLGYADYVKNLAGGCVGSPVVMWCGEGYACSYETFQPNIPAYGIISCIAR